MRRRHGSFQPSETLSIDLCRPIGAFVRARLCGGFYSCGDISSGFQRLEKKKKKSFGQMITLSDNVEKSGRPLTSRTQRCSYEEGGERGWSVEVLSNMSGQ